MSALEAAVERLAARAGDGETITAEQALWEVSECERRAAMMGSGCSIAPAKADCDIHRDRPSAPAEVAKVSNIAEYTAIWRPGKPVQEFFDGQLLGIYRIVVKLLGDNHSEVARFLGMNRSTLHRWLGRAERRINRH